MSLNIKAKNFLDLAIGIAVDLLVPLAIVEASGKRQLLRFEAESQEKAMAEGKVLLARREKDRDAWVVAREGKIQEAGVYVDVLTIEAIASGAAASGVFVQRFQPFASGKFKLLGAPLVSVGGKQLSSAEAAPLLARLRAGIQSHPRAAEQWPKWSPP